MPKPCCVKCEREMQLEKIGVVVLEMFENSEDVYRVWHADKWKCPQCSNEVVTGYADKPFERFTIEEIQIEQAIEKCKLIEGLDPEFIIMRSGKELP